MATTTCVCCWLLVEGPQSDAPAANSQQHTHVVVAINYSGL